MNEVLYESQKIVATNKSEKIKITSTSDVEKLQQIIDIKDKVQEHFIAITLDTKNHIKSIELVGIGSVSCIPMDISDIVRCAITRGAAKLIIAHNHPSGDNTPSKYDLIFTKRLNTIASYLNIKLLDHIIVGDTCLSIMQQYENLTDIDIENLKNDVICQLQKENNKLKEKINILERNKKIGIKEKIKIAEEISKTQNKEKGNKQKEQVL